MASKKPTKKTEFPVGVVRMHDDHWAFVNANTADGETLTSFLREGALLLAEKRAGKKRPDAPIPQRGPSSESGQAAVKLGLTAKQFRKYAAACGVAAAEGKAAPKPSAFAAE